ncbi:peptidoglycan/LPS O-acetylase OafA/YrhL [Bradyrhizobium sp. USDA 4474]
MTVAYIHFQQLSGSAHGLFAWQHAAVDLFFCLSGFTLSYVYRREHFQFSSYIIARIARIYPLYFVTLIIAGAGYILPIAINPENYPVSAASTDFLLQLSMLNSLPVIGSGVFWNPPAWSISVEWLCYLVLFPLLLHAKAPRSPNARLICLVVLGAASYVIFVQYFDEHLTVPELYVAKSQWSYWVNPIRGILEFTSGWLAFFCFNTQDDLCVFSGRHSTYIWLTFVAILVFQFFGIVSSQALIFLFPFVILAATNPASLTSRVLASTGLHFIGVISYSIYMTHVIVLMAFGFVFGLPDTWPMQLYAVTIVAAFAVSVCSFFALERPARNIIRIWRNSGQRQASSVG